MSATEEVRKASNAFYAALTRMCNGDANAFAEVWSHGTSVTAMHPIGGREVGWDAVKHSFAQVAQLAAGGRVELRDQYIHLAGDTAYETGTEHGHILLADQRVDIDLRVTNIYGHSIGGWKIIHHHTDISPAMLDVVSRMQPPKG